MLSLFCCFFVVVVVVSLNSENQSRNELHMMPPDGEGKKEGMVQVMFR